MKGKTASATRSVNNESNFDQKSPRASDGQIECPLVSDAARILNMAAPVCGFFFFFAC